MSSGGVERAVAKGRYLPGERHYMLLMTWLSFANPGSESALPVLLTVC
jgi:hypothetical protein